MPLTPDQLNNVSQPYKSSIHRHALGVPSLGIWKIVSRNGHVGFFPIIPRSGEAVFEAQRVLGDVNRDYPIPSYFNALTVPLYWRTFAFEMVFAPPITRDDPAHNKIVHEATVRITETAAKHGWGDYRAAPIYQDMVAETYSFGDHALPLPRDAEGCGGSERHPRARPRRRLAAPFPDELMRRVTLLGLALPNISAPPRRRWRSRSGWA